MSVAGAQDGTIRILYIDHTARLGGGEIALADLIGAIDKQRYTPVVVLSSDGPLAERLRSAGIETHVVPLSPAVVDMRKDSLDLRSLSRIRDIWSVLTYARTIAAWAKRNRIAIIHANSLKADICGGIAGRLAGIPVVWHVRDNIAEPYLHARTASLFRMLARRLPTAVIGNSASTLRTLALPAKKMSAVVYSGLTGPVAAEPGTKDRAPVPVITMVGRIAEWKGQHVLIEAAKTVLASYPTAEFWIVGAPLFGENDYEQRIKSQVDSLGIADRVKFLGFRNDIQAVLSQSTIVAHASIQAEPFGQVVVQGMAAGKPVIATDGGALPEIVIPGTGMLVPMGDVASMAEAILWLLGHPDEAQQMGRAAQERVRDCFSIAQSAAVVESLYDRLLDSRRHSN